MSWMVPPPMASAGQEDLDIRPELTKDLRRGDLRGVEAPGVQDDLLLRPGMPQLRDGVGVLIVDGAAAETAQARLRQVLLQLFGSSRLNDAEPGGHGVVPAAGPPYFSLSMRIALSPFSPRGTGAEILAGN